MPLAPDPNPVEEKFGICPGCNTQIEPHEVIYCICRCGDQDADVYDRMAEEADAAEAAKQKSE